jgi:hypothetical protein
MKFFKDSQNTIYAFEADGSQDAFIKPGFVSITVEEVEALRLQNTQAVLDARPYTEKRASEYPPIGDQLDALFKAGVFPADLAARIQAVKDKYPKV